MFPLPTHSEILKDPRGHRYMNYQFHTILNQWSMHNAYYISCILEGKLLNENIIEELRKLHDAKLELFISDYNGWSSVLTIKKPEEEEREIDPAQLELLISKMTFEEDSHIIRHTLSADIFIELSRTHFLIMHRTIIEESDQVLQSGNVGGLKVVWWSMNNTVHLGSRSSKLDCKLPIMSYKQSDIMNALLMLTEVIDQLPIEALPEVKHVLLLLYTRNSVFFCDKVPVSILDSMKDAEGYPTRDYMTFCATYFHVVQRRIYYAENIKRHEIGKLTTHCKKWFEIDACNNLGSDGFEDEYNKACEEAYQFPGDLEWFTYRYPDLSVQTGPILDCFRKELAKQYCTNYRVSKEVLIASLQLASHTGQCARLFFLNTIDQYMKVQFSIPWKDGIVVKNCDLEKTSGKLLRNGAPYIVQIFSRFWVYQKGEVYCSDDILQVFAYWLLVVKRDYGGKVFGTDLTKLINKVIK